MTDLPVLSAPYKLIFFTKCGFTSLGATISGSGPSMLLWAREEHAADVAGTAEVVLAAAGVAARVRPSKCTPVGCRARWTGGSDLRLARAVG